MDVRLAVACTLAAAVHGDREVLPGMVAMTSLVAAAFLGVGVGLALVMGAALAPTDPVLASNVVGGLATRTIPLALRQDLSLESGANDGLAAIFVILAAAGVTTTSLVQGGIEGVWSVTGPMLIGVVIGMLAGDGLNFAEAHRGTDRTRAASFSLVLALAVLGIATLLKASDLLTVFVVVALSILSHGLSATPGRILYGRVTNRTEAVTS